MGVESDYPWMEEWRMVRALEVGGGEGWGGGGLP